MPRLAEPEPSGQQLTPACGARCLNCSTPLIGRYCHACGQQDLDPHPTVREIVGDVFQEVANVDGKLLRTLRWLVSRPGGLTAETLAGHRASYASPVRLYLICSLIFFALTAISPGGGIVTYKGPAEGTVSAEEAAKARLQGEALVQTLSARMQKFMPHAMFALMPIFALLTLAFYRRSQARYIAHLYYALHFHSIAFLIFSAAIALSFGGRWLAIPSGLLPFAVFYYHYAGLRRVFGSSRGATALKGTAIALLYSATIATVFVAITLWSVRDVRKELSSPSAVPPRPAVDLEKPAGR